MFDIGFLELLICGVIALLVLGPERLPTAARAAGRWIGGARRMVSQFTSELAAACFSPGSPSVAFLLGSL